MSLSEDYVRKAQEKYVRAYLQCRPYSFYAFRCLVFSLRVIRDIEKREVRLRGHESIDDLCFYVSFRWMPPKEVRFPATFEQVRVFYRHFGNV